MVSRAHLYLVGIILSHAPFGGQPLASSSCHSVVVCSCTNVCNLSSLHAVSSKRHIRESRLQRPPVRDSVHGRPSRRSVCMSLNWIAATTFGTRAIKTSNQLLRCATMDRRTENGKRTSALGWEDHVRPCQMRRVHKIGRRWKVRFGDKLDQKRCRSLSVGRDPGDWTR